MLELAFRASDVAQTRFAFSVLGEVVTSVRVLKDSAYHAAHLAWILEVRDRLRAQRPENFQLLWDLIPADGGRVPDFVTPQPFTPMPELRRELADLTAIPAAQVRSDLDDAGGPRSSCVRALYDDPATGLVELATAVRSYWAAALASHWPRVLALLQADVIYRAQRIAQGGAALLFDDLHPTVTWHDDALQVAHRPYAHRRSAQGRGMLLVPSAFVWPRVFTSTAKAWQPTLVYPARGVATLWETDQLDAPHALARVLGKTRAELLADLSAPATPVELARRARLSTGAVSEHLTALRTAGLAVASRHGRQMVYARSAVAETMIEGGPVSRRRR